MDKKEKNTTRERVIDKEVKNAYSWWSSAFVIIKKTRVKTWKGVFIIAFVAGTVSTLILNVAMNIQSMSDANGEVASLALNPSTVSVAPGETFTVDIILNTNSNDVVATRAIVNYDVDNFSLTGWDTTNSIFVAGNTCVYNSKPCEIVSNDTSAGSISITLAKPSPGVNTSSGVIATLTFQATDSAQSDNITIDFNSKGDYTDSDVIFDGDSDDGVGTDILSNVTNASVTISALDTTAPTLAEVNAITSPTSDSTPSYTFSSTEAGTITYGGSCSSSTTQATIGNNTISFNTLTNGIYSDCTIIVTDASSNASDALSVSNFRVNTQGGNNRADVDQNGSVSTADAQLALRKSVGLDMSRTAWHDFQGAGDVDCNGSVNTADALLMLRNSVGLSMSQTDWCVND